MAVDNWKTGIQFIFYLLWISILFLRRNAQLVFQHLFQPYDISAVIILWSFCSEDLQESSLSESWLHLCKYTRVLEKAKNSFFGAISEAALCPYITFVHTELSLTLQKKEGDSTCQEYQNWPFYRNVDWSYCDCSSFHWWKDLSVMCPENVLRQESL